MRHACRCGAGKSRIAPSTLKARDGRTLEGSRVVVDYGGQCLVQEVYGLASGPPALVLLLQDAPDDPEKPTSEFREAVDLLLATLEVKAR